MNQPYEWAETGERRFKWWWIPVGFVVASFILGFLIMTGQEVWSWFQST